MSMPYILRTMKYLKCNFPGIFPFYFYPSGRLNSIIASNHFFPDPNWTYSKPAIGPQFINVQCWSLNIKHDIVLTILNNEFLG